MYHSRTGKLVLITIATAEELSTESERRLVHR